MKKRIFSALAMVLICAMLVPVYAAWGSYTDVSADSWYRNAARFNEAAGLMNGMGNREFVGKGTLDRAMFVTMLHRLAGTPESELELPFSDVDPDEYYTPAVRWAVENEIVLGMTETTFCPKKEITREQMACMIARYLVKTDSEVLDGPEAEQYFADQDTVSDYAAEAVELMRSTGLFRGDNHSNFRPRANATRAEAATLFQTLSLAMKKIPAQALVHSGEAQNTMTVQDTILLYKFISRMDANENLYGEYIPDYEIQLWDGIVLTVNVDAFQENLQINYIDGDQYLGLTTDFPDDVPFLLDLLEKYR